MRNLIIYIVLVFLFGSFADETFDQMAKKMGTGKAEFISITDFNELIKRKKEMVILDTREGKEWKVSHIKNAVCVGYDKFSVGSMSKYPKTMMVICYCSVGYRSQKIGTKLLNKGFKSVYNLYGGIFNWVNQGNEIVDSKGEKTNKIHAYNKDWAKWLIKGEKVFN